jgi:hypothetical protein
MKMTSTLLSEEKLHPAVTSPYHFQESPPIPAELADSPNWKLCYLPEDSSSGTPKQPIGGPLIAPRVCGTLTSIAAKADKTRNQFLGYCFDINDSYIMLDIDQLEPAFTTDSLLGSLRDFLLKYPTYTEISASTQGLHVFYKINPSALKSFGGSKLRFKKRPGLPPYLGHSGSIFVHSCFAVVTGWSHPVFSTQAIAKLPKQLLELLLPTATKEEQTQYINTIEETKLKSTEDLPFDITELINALAYLPPSLSVLPTNSTQRYLFERAILQDFHDPHAILESDYAWWLTITSAVAHAYSLFQQAQDPGPFLAEEIKQGWINWCLDDPKADEYGDINPQDLAVKFETLIPSLDSAPPITYKTLFRMAQSHRPVWLLKQMGTKKDPRYMPDIARLENWERLIDFYELEFQYPALSPASAKSKIQIGRVITRKPEHFQHIIEEYFTFIDASNDPFNSYNLVHMDQINTSFLKLAQTEFAPNQLVEPGTSYGQIKPAARDLIASRLTGFEPMVQLIDEIPAYPDKELDFQEDQKPKNWIKWFFDRIKFISIVDQHQRNFYYSAFKKHLLSLIRNVYASSNIKKYKPLQDLKLGQSLLIILQGPQASYKSTFLENILPSKLDVYTLSSSFTKTDLNGAIEAQRELTQCYLWVKDEIDALLTERNDSFWKDVITKTKDQFRQMYIEEVATKLRKSIMWGTTNHDTLTISRYGTRRFVVFPVEVIDTLPLLGQDMPKERLLAQLKYELDKQLHLPIAEKLTRWSLTPEEIHYNEHLLLEEASESSAELELANLISKKAHEDFEPFRDLDTVQLEPEDLSGFIKALIDHFKLPAYLDDRDAWQIKSSFSTILHESSLKKFNQVVADIRFHLPGESKISAAAAKHVIKRMQQMFFGKLAGYELPVPIKTTSKQELYISKGQLIYAYNAKYRGQIKRRTAKVGYLWPPLANPFED